MSVIISNKVGFEKKKANFIKEGVNKIHILTDFDRTFTKAFFRKEKVSSLISKLRRGDYISKEYSQKAKELFEKYHPIEVSNKITPKEKSEKMLEWWSTHYKLLIESGLTEVIIDRCVQDMVHDGDMCSRYGS